MNFPSDKTQPIAETRPPTELRAAAGATTAKPRLLFLLTATAVLAAVQSLNSLWLTWGERPKQAWLDVPVALLAVTAIGGLMLFGVRQALLRGFSFTLNRGVGHRRPGVQPSATTCAPTPSLEPVDEADIPKVVMSRELLKIIEDDTEAALRRLGPDHETGGAFAGTVERDHAGRVHVLRIDSFIPAGPASKCSPFFFEPDSAFQLAHIRFQQLGDPGRILLGLCHRHPGTQTENSPPDWDSDVKSLSEKSDL